MARQDREESRRVYQDRGEEELVVCMGPQMEVSRSVRGHKHHLLRALPLFFLCHCFVCLTETRRGLESWGE